MYIFIVIMAAIAFFEAPKLLRQKLRGELLSFGALWSMAFGYGTLVILRVGLPTVLEVVQFLYAFAGLQAVTFLLLVAAG